jgi:hypothetical protein
MLFMEIIALHSENYTKLINTLYGKNPELVTVKVEGTFHLPLSFKELNCKYTRKKYDQDHT